LLLFLLGALVFAVDFFLEEPDLLCCVERIAPCEMAFGVVKMMFQFVHEVLVAKPA
jgi:hypothetical protein